jgi:TonB-linked SusC/RagA family outer membrane protein
MKNQRNLMRKMKFFVFMLLFSTYSLFAEHIFSQRAKFSFNMTDATINEIITYIENNSDYVFVFSDNPVIRQALDKKINVKAEEGEELGVILDRVLTGNNLSYRVIEEQIIVYQETETETEKKKKKDEQLPSTDVRQSGDIRVTGIVADENGDPLPGATVSIKDSPRGVMTDLDGKFSIEVRPTDVLLISYLGYNEYKVAVGDKRKFDIQLKLKENELEEVTIVAFGKQKKESVIGSVTTIAPKNLKVPSSNLTTAFAGQMAGVIAYQRSGEPGADDADFYVRGITTFGVNRNPLILIDNIELTKTDLARLQPDDIASFSVMKDATATALYGARGANGVILITTKQGEEGPPKVSFRVEQSFSASTDKVELAGPVTWMKLANEAVLTRNPMGYAPFTEEKIDNTINGTDPLRYPAVDWMDMLIRDNTTSSRYNIQLSGGGKAHRYYIAGALNHDNGIMKVDKRNNFNNNINNNSYSLRSNIELQVTPTTMVNVRLSGLFDDYSGPLTSGTDLFMNIIKSNTVLFPAYYPATGSYSEIRHIMFGNKDNQYYNPYAESVRGYKEKTRSQLLAQVEAKQELDFLTEGLSVRAMMNLSRLSQFSVNRSYTPYWYEVRGVNPITGEYMINNTNTGTDWLDYGERR